MSRALVARAPARIDFGGGWTDVAEYARNDGGAVCNVAISLHATATVAADGHVAVRRSGAHGGDDALVKAALRRSPIPGVEGTVVAGFPIGAGLGGSAAAGVALAGALSKLAGEEIGCAELAERSRVTEVEELGVAGGCQDHYASAFGGALLLTISECVGVEQLAMPEPFAASLARRAILLHSGESRLSSTMITAVMDAWRSGDARVVEALARMRSLATEMGAAIRAQDLEALGALVGEHWRHQRALHPAITTLRLDAIMDAAARHGALGAKALGASGGGCVIAIAREGRESELAGALATLGERLDWSVDRGGFEVIATMTGELGPDGSA